MPDSILFTIFLIFTGSALVATLALFARQAMIVGYILLGMLLGPHMLGLVQDPDLISQMSHIGIIFLLFLLGLDLPPRKLMGMLGETVIVTGLSSLAFFVIAAIVLRLAGFGWIETLIASAAFTFSSTIIGLKLLPTTILHHRRTGEIIISILLFQDVLAIILLMAIEMAGTGEADTRRLFVLTLALPGLFGLALWLARRLVVPLIARFDTIQEYVFLLTIGWCLGIAELAGAMGLSQEIGAFMAGVALASSPVAQYIAESLKPLRDFFLIIFFFALGAGFDPMLLPQIWMPALALALLALLVKPWVFRRLLVRAGEDPQRSAEIGVRLGQISEFALLVAVLAQQNGVIPERASILVQAATLLTFIASGYWVVMRYPTPVAVNEKLRRN
ncbi:MAG TPA: cation:proton antiporter [Thiotrichales bacterium]|nr:cation:proton antiporter [Thiotrichales bacterium]